MSAPTRSSDWPAVRLRFVAEVNPLPPARDILDDELEVSFLPMEAIGENGSLRLDAHRPVAELRGGYSYFADGDVAFAKVTPCFENGKGAVMRGLSGGVGFGSTELTVLRPGPRLDAQFLHFFLCSPLFRGPGAGAMMGAGGLKRVPDEFTRNTLLPHPPRHVQAAVTRLLDRETARIDALIEKKSRFIELLREKRQAVITAAVTKGIDPSSQMKSSGDEWLGDVPSHWALVRFQRVVDVAEGQVDPEAEPYRAMLLLAPNHIESGTGRIICTETAAEQGAESGKYLCAPGDVVYSKIRPALRKVCIAPEVCLCSADMYPLRGKHGLRNDFLLWYLLSEPFSAFAVLEADRVAMPKINRESLAQLLMAVPPHGEQVVICAHLDSVTRKLDALLGRTDASIGLLKERRAALITAAVTGQIDVRAEQPDSTLEPV